jgi:hypothetical protein
MDVIEVSITSIHLTVESDLLKDIKCTTTARDEMSIIRYKTIK